MLTRRRYLLALSPEHEAYAERIAGMCRAVWNTGLEQRREYRRRGAFIGYVQQCREMAEAKTDPDCEWLKDAPGHCLQQTLRDLEKACKRHGTFRVRWKSARKSPHAFRFPDPKAIKVERLNRRWGQVKLPKFGWLRFRWTRPVGGEIHHATMVRDGGKWYVSILVEDGLSPAEPNGKPPVGVDRGIIVAVATSDDWRRNRKFLSSGEVERMRRLHRRMDLRRKGSNRRRASIAALAKIYMRGRNRRQDFNMWTANRLTLDHGLVVIEDLNVHGMTASAKGTLERPGRNVKVKAGLNGAIRSKGWGILTDALEHKARYNGAEIVRVKAAHTSVTCSGCGIRDSEARETQARFACRSCGYTGNADVNAAKNILAAGLAVTGRGDVGATRSAKRQPPVAA